MIVAYKNSYGEIEAKMITWGGENGERLRVMAQMMESDAFDGDKDPVGFIDVPRKRLNRDVVPVQLAEAGSIPMIALWGSANIPMTQ